MATVSKSHTSLLIPPSSLAGVFWRNGALRLQQGFHEKAMKFNCAELYLWTGCTVRKNERLALTHHVNFMNIWWFGVTAQAVIVVIADLSQYPALCIRYWIIDLYKDWFSYNFLGLYISQTGKSRDSIKVKAFNHVMLNQVDWFPFIFYRHL